jgi:hypothetical protein
MSEIPKMLKLRSRLNTRIHQCSKKVKDPIVLPCDDTICSEQLSEKDVVNANRKIAPNVNKSVKSKKINLDRIKQTRSQ